MTQVDGIGFVISLRCSNRLISSEFFQLVFESSCLLATAVEFTYYLCVPTAIDALFNETITFYDRLSSIVDGIQTHDHLLTCSDFNATFPVNGVHIKTEAVNLIIALIILNPSLNATICLPPIHSQSTNPIVEWFGLHRPLSGRKLYPLRN